LPKLELSVPVTVACSPEQAFDYFADYHHVADVLEGISRWKPLGSQTQGVGARYAVEMLALGFPLRSVLRLNRWRRPQAIGWISESGLIKQEGGFTFTPAAKGVRIVASTLDVFVRRRLAAAMERIRATLESPV
jgi:hypothetical protein